MNKQPSFLVQPIQTFYVWGKGGRGWLKIAFKWPRNCGVRSTFKSVFKKNKMWKFIPAVEPPNKIMKGKKKKKESQATTERLKKSC